MPTTPGTDILKDAKEALEAAGKIGYPVFLKASAGGGGKGIRLVERPEEMERAFRLRQTRRKKRFGDGKNVHGKISEPGQTYRGTAAGG